VVYTFGEEPKKLRVAKDDDDFEFGDLVPF